jgi:ABC-type glycerol-3-phosphate transport system permease component
MKPDITAHVEVPQSEKMYQATYILEQIWQWFVVMWKLSALNYTNSTYTVAAQHKEL